MPKKHHSQHQDPVYTVCSAVVITVAVASVVEFLKNATVSCNTLSVRLNCTPMFIFSFLFQMWALWRLYAFVEPLIE